VLEFVANIDGIYVNGIDMIAWNDDDEITSFKVMLRPLKGIQAIMRDGRVVNAVLRRSRNASAGIGRSKKCPWRRRSRTPGVDRRSPHPRRLPRRT